MNRLLIILFLLSVNLLSAQENTIWLHSNKGQWDSRILYKVDLQMGEMLVEEDGFIYKLNDYKQKMSHDHGGHEKTIHQDDQFIRKQIIKTKFIKSNWNGKKVEKKASSFYQNYFLGDDPSKWKTNVRSVGTVIMEEIYDNIDLVIDGSNANLEYSFLIKKKAKSSRIKYEIRGASGLKLNNNGSLSILNRFGEIIESKPVAWNVVENKKIVVDVEFELKDGIVSFYFPNGYDENYDLVIDPSITFSTFSGSTADNWGMTSTPDNHGNLYAAGIVFNDGGEYPVTTGVFDEEINGGDSNPFANYVSYGFDVAISKFNEDGSELLFATYLGGAGNETPHSLVVDGNDNLYLLGATSSNNFPTSNGCFDNTFNGGSPELNNNLYFTASDIFISKISNNGIQLLGSTYIGGTGNDGLNTGDLDYNYGDSFRGEIIHGEDDFIYVSTTTRSTDFPTTNPFQDELKGEQDAVVFKINDDLTSFSWSSYFGGNGEETGNSIQKSSTGDVYFTGGSTSSEIVNFNGVEGSYIGGTSDGYLIRLNANSGNIINSTFVGDTGYDQVYFVQLDQSDNVYVYGQTESGWAITPGLYGTANSGQFIRKFNSSLSSVEWTTMIGAGTGYPEISPTAFLVSNCDEIYLAGWGGLVNHYSDAIHSTTSGFETTPDAFQSMTSGSNFYIAVLEKDAAGLKYGTFMGGYNSSSNHVDGGTSRFDKNGKIYHAVCAACGGDPNGFTSTLSVYSPTNQSNNCNLAAFKFELNSVEVDGTSIAPSLCINDPNVFYGLSSNGNSFYWDFGDGTYSSEQSPSHAYSLAGLYSVSLTISDTISCFASKTKTFEVEVLDLQVGIQFFDSVMCSGIDYNLVAFGGDDYLWTPTGLFSSPYDSSTFVNVTQDTTLHVRIENICFIDSFSFDISVSDITPTLTNDTTICENQEVQFFINNSVSQVWSPSTYLNDPISYNPISKPDTSVIYNVEITTGDGCVFNEVVNIEVNPQIITSIFPSEYRDTSLCIGEFLNVQLDNTLSQEWSPSNLINAPFSQNPTITVDTTTIIYVTAKTTDYCYLRDSLIINIFYNIPSPVLLDTIRNCIGDSTFLKFNGAEYYDFTLNSNYNILSSDSLSCFFTSENYFYCDFINACGSYLDSVFIMPIKPSMDICNDTIICPGEQAFLWADSMMIYNWYSEQDYLSEESSIEVSPKVNSQYIVIGEDEFGCFDTSFVSVELFDTPRIRLMDDYLASLDEEVKIEVFTGDIGTYEWSPKEFLSCYNCEQPIANPNKNTIYTTIFTDTNGCKTSDEIRIYYDGILYVPNTFTPNVDGKFNTHFSAEGINIVNYEMLIFDRWGHLVYETRSLYQMWDGTFEGVNCQMGTYIWKISYEDISGNKKELVGHVNLLR